MSERDGGPALKPCPFCGGKAILYDLLDTHGCFSVECFNCDTDKSDTTKAGVIEAWNRRTHPGAGNA